MKYLYSILYTFRIRKKDYKAGNVGSLFHIPAFEVGLFVVSMYFEYELTVYEIFSR
jgi:hypothetical protein